MNPARHALPNFVVIGAVKAATTWVARQLRNQPGVFLPQAEPHFFSTEYQRGVDWYAELFAPAPDGALVGEKSADYLAHPKAAQRLSRLLPEARLVVQLRNPVERAYSDYCMLFRRGMVDADIARHLAPGGPEPRFLQDGFYWQHLARWLDHFEARQLHILLYEDVPHDPAGVLQQVATHVGLQGQAIPVAPEVRHNDSRAPILPLGLRRSLAPLKPLVAPLRSKPWFRSLHGAIARPIDYPPIRADIRQRLTDIYASDIEQLARYLKRDLGAWLEPERRAA